MFKKIPVWLAILSFLSVNCLSSSSLSAQELDLNSITITRLLDKAIVEPGLHLSIGNNISIVDPLFTIPALIFVGIAIKTKKRIYSFFSIDSSQK